MIFKNQNNKKFNSYLKNIIIILALTSLIAITVLTIFLNTTLKKFLTNDVIARQKTIAISKAKMIDLKKQYILKDLIFASKLPEFNRLKNVNNINRKINGIPENNSRTKRTIMETIRRKHTQVNVTYVLKPDGGHYFSQPFKVQKKLTKYNLSSRPYFKKAKKTKKPVISNSFIGADGQPAVAILVPVVRKNKIICYLGSVIYLKSFSNILKKQRIEDFENAYVFDNNGYIISHTNYSLERNKKSRPVLEYKKIFQNFKLKKNDKSNGYEYFLKTYKFRNAHEILSIFIKLKCGWVLALSSNKEKISLIVNTKIWRIILFVLFILAIINIIGIYFSRKTGLKWINAEKEIEDKNDELENKVKIRTSDLVKSNHELADSNRKLEIAYEEAQAAFEEAEAAYSEMETQQGELIDTNEKLEIALSKAEESNRLKSEFLAMMSHELRTPLAGMLGFSELLLRDKNLEDKHLEYAGYIFSSGKRLLHVLTDLLEISVIQAGKISIEYFDLNIDKLIQDIYVLLEDTFKKKNIEFETNIQAGPIITSDPPRLRQILFNLIGNAVKFTEKGKVSVEVSEYDNKYVFKITDTGIGIDDKDKEVIFDMFRQVESSKLRKYGGTGLGLAICKRLINALKGEIWLESNPGKGSVFFFSLPAIEPTDKPDLSDKKEQDVKKTKKNIVKILFAEDDEINFQFLKNIIKTHDNFISKGFYNGKKLLEEYKENNNYDIILLDIAMPVMDGVETVIELRKMNKDIPIIAITAFGMKYDDNKYLKLGFNDYISKPLTIERFNEVVKLFIEE